MGSVETSDVKLVKLNGVCSLESMSRVGEFMIALWGGCFGLGLGGRWFI